MLNYWYERILGTYHIQVASDACWALSYVTDGSTDRIQAVMDAGAVPRLAELLGSNEIACAVSNETACAMAVVQTCNPFRITSSLPPPLPPDPCAAYNREHCDRQ